MKPFFKKLIKKLMPEPLLDQIRLKTKYVFSTGSFSQEGEDLILHRIFERKSEGFYVDVGAHHPFRFSNTYLFYRKGWRGINIEPNPEAIKLFKKYRPRDINLNLAIGQGGELIYYMFNEQALNTFDKSLAMNRTKSGEYHIIKEMKIEIYPLKEVLDMNLPDSQEIDFMNVDCEGMDLDILKSNDWSNYRPKIILVEIIPPHDIPYVLNHPIAVFLQDNGYTFFAKCFNSCFFSDKTLEL
ncbi:MAG: FkbM family methyltransferase [bacterium]|nr:FkbM family methyltransferase [bacterium]